MQIQLVDANNANAVVLVHGPASASPTYAQGPIGEDTTFQSQQSVQVYPVIRSTFAKVFYRSNLTSTYPFKALREFASLEDALFFAAQHSIDVQAKPKLELLGEDKKIVLHGGISNCQCKRKGITVEIEYSFTYGKAELVDLEV